jgi:hypothetical protein
MQKTSEDMPTVFMRLSKDGKYILHIVNPNFKLPEGVSELAFISAEIEASGVADCKELLTIEEGGNFYYALPADLNPKCKGLAEFCRRMKPLIFQKQDAKTPEEHKIIGREFGEIVKEIKGDIKEQEGSA